MTDDVLDALEAKLGATELEWDPSVKPRIVGYVDSFDSVMTKDGSTFPLIRLRERDGTILRVPAGRAVLSRRLVDERIQPGDALGIEYRGTKMGKNGRSFHDYAVRVERIGDRRPADAFAPIDDLGLVPGIESPFGTHDGTVQ